jgi:hypothetical protein
MDGIEAVAEAEPYALACDDDEAVGGVTKIGVDSDVNDGARASTVGWC